jgi:hypothetical protein
VVLDALQRAIWVRGSLADLVFVRRMGCRRRCSFSGSEVRFDRAAKVVTRISLSDQKRSERRFDREAEMADEFATTSRQPAVGALPAARTET